MTVAAGEAVYDMGSPPCSGVGLRWSDGEMNAAMDGRVAAVLFDDGGKADIEDILAGLAETEFEQAGLRRVLRDPDRVEDWRVGEVIAEAYLTDHRSCTFPWPDGRDERKSGSSLPGADLVGFGIDGDGDCFAFGEVKTSREARYPPGTMRGRTGLKKQLEDLRDRNAIRADLGERFGEESDDDAQDVMDETNPALDPAHRPRELDRVAAQRIGRGGQTRGLLGMRHHRFDLVKLTRKPCGQTVRQQAEGGVAVATVPASNLCPARGLARVGAVARERTAPVRVIRAALEPCSAPRLGLNVLLAGKPRLVAKLHRPWPGGGPPARANSSLV